jgi:hypothetical protein
MFFNLFLIGSDGGFDTISPRFSKFNCILHAISNLKKVQLHNWLSFKGNLFVSDARNWEISRKRPQFYSK